MGSGLSGRAHIDAILKMKKALDGVWGAGPTEPRSGA
jgi:hypothetical protein